MLLLCKFLQPARKTVGGLLFVTSYLIPRPLPDFVSQALVGRAWKRDYYSASVTHCMEGKWTEIVKINR